MAKASLKTDTVGKIAAIMRLLCSSNDTYSLREIEGFTGIPKSTLHRLLKSSKRKNGFMPTPRPTNFAPESGFSSSTTKSSFIRP